MSELNQNFEQPAEQDQPATGSSGGNPLHEEVLRGWHTKSLMEAVDKNQNKTINKKDELEKDINATHQPPAGQHRLSKEQLQIAERINQKFDHIKSLNHDNKFFGHDARLFPDAEISEKDLSEFLGEQPAVKELEDAFLRDLKARKGTKEMLDDNNDPDHTKYHYIEEVLKAMARGDERGLARILDRYGSLWDHKLQDYTSTANEIMKSSGGSINITKNAGNPVYGYQGKPIFENLVFPPVKGQTMNNPDGAVPAKVVTAAGTEPAIVYTSKDQEVRVSPDRPRKYRGP